MKNTILFLFASLFLVFSATAQKKKAKVSKINVPVEVTSSFSTNYEGAEKTKWSTGYTGNYVAKFSNATAQNQEVEYSKNGTLLKSKTTLDITSSVPEVISNALKAKYADANLQELTKIEIPGIAPYYKAVVLQNEKQKELYISEEGLVTR
ncbi:MAG: PepSY-like domain-containing protein [Ferruginibacter sp.]